MAYHRQGDNDALEKQPATVQGPIALLKKASPKPSASIVPWAVPFAILMAERELERIELPAAEN